MSIITLTTDFGVGSPYVASMKGVMLGISPAATIVDVTHAIRPQNVREAAWVLADTTPWFPADTIHVAVVDPGVGTTRRLLYARMGAQQYLAPDNGILSRLAERTPPSTIVELAEREFWLPAVSATFHGRDILAPVAARLATGLDPARLGPMVCDWTRLTFLEVRIMPGRIAGHVARIDSFGNLITDIPADALADAPRDQTVRIVVDEHETFGIFRTYADQPEMTLVALVGSSGYLEIAIVNDNAAAMLGVRVGETVEVTWPTA